MNGNTSGLENERGIRLNVAARLWNCRSDLQLQRWWHAVFVPESWYSTEPAEFRMPAHCVTLRRVQPGQVQTRRKRKKKRCKKWFLKPYWAQNVGSCCCLTAKMFRHDGSLRKWWLIYWLTTEMLAHMHNANNNNTIIFQEEEKKKGSESSTIAIKEITNCTLMVQPAV